MKVFSNIKRDLWADYLVNQLSKFIILNSKVDACDECISFIDHYLKCDEKYNKLTAEEINILKKYLCDTSKKCEKAYCIASDLIDIIDTDQYINQIKENL